MYGATMYNIFKQIKWIFDDKKIMNPGKKVL
jgi:FAD/FMN-containing dehydrogenase